MGRGVNRHVARAGRLGHASRPGRSGGFTRPSRTPEGTNCSAITGSGDRPAPPAPAMSDANGTRAPASREPSDEQPGCGCTDQPSVRRSIDGMTARRFAKAVRRVIDSVQATSGIRPQSTSIDLGIYRSTCTHCNAPAGRRTRIYFEQPNTARSAAAPSSVRTGIPSD